ncbi:MAG: hypothetical protein ACO3LD_03480 [Luminiphilus sp.]
MIDFGPWLPDLPSLNHPGVAQLTNGFPAIRGFTAVPSASTVTQAKQSTGSPAADSNMPTIIGMHSTLTISGNTITPQTFVGTDTRLLKLDSGTKKFSQFTTSDPTYTAIPRWRFVEFATTGGTRYVYAAGGTSVDLQRFEVDGNSAPETVPNGNVPNPTHLAVVGRFLVCGNTANSEAEVRWSSIDDGNNWTIGTNQADAQIIADASEVTGLVGGETGLVLTREGLYRLNYVGAPLVFTFDKVSNRGCEFAGSVASRSADEVYFLSEDGFHRYAGGAVQNIGAQRVNDFFFSDFDRARASDITCVIDPARSLVIWSYGSTNASGENDSLIAYDYVLDRWGFARLQHQTVGTLRQLGTTLESLNTDAAGNAQTLDDLILSLDSPTYAGGTSSLAVAQTTDAGSVIATLTGAPLDLTLQTGEFEPAETQYAMIRGIYPHIDANGNTTTVSCAVGSRTRQTDQLSFAAAASVNSSNVIPARKSGRYFAARFTASGDWDNAHGFSVDLTPQGRR